MRVDFLSELAKPMPLALQPEHGEILRAFQPHGYRDGRALYEIDAQIEVPRVAGSDYEELRLLILDGVAGPDIIKINGKRPDANMDGDIIKIWEVDRLDAAVFILVPTRPPGIIPGSAPAETSELLFTP